MKIAEEENSLMKNTKRKRHKILRKKGSETKQGFETSSSSSENEKKSTDSVSINFLLEILVFNFFKKKFIPFNRLSFFFYEFIFHELII